MGNDNFTAAPSGVFRTRDGYLNIAANKQEQWESVADVLGLPELKADARFREREDRKKNRKDLTPLLEEKLMQRETAAWVKELNDNNVPAGAILTLEGAVHQAQVAHRDAFGSVTVPGLGDLRVFNLTAKFSKTPGRVTAPPPALGEHTREVLGGIGYTEEDVAGLKEAGIV
jgi:crotonobetainyl-CoA:carnitine CoA-transferase CaiB-like acyl-CoA transferase